MRRRRDRASLHVASSLTVVVDGANVESFLALPSSVTSPNQRPYTLWLVPCQSVAKLSPSVQGILSRAGERATKGTTTPYAGAKITALSRVR